jgi:4-hydroxy-2-oxoheptanedioate aldolase
VKTGRLNGAIKALEEGRTALVAWSPTEVATARALNAARYDAVVFEMEHRPYDGPALRDCLQYMLDRRQILTSGGLAPAVTPLARIPPNGGELSQWFAKQVLDVGVYGVIWPHVSTVQQAANAVGACRYPRLASAPNPVPQGLRGDGPGEAARYWGLTQQEYYARADVWPLAPDGEILVGIMCEDLEGIRNLPDILTQVPGIGVVLIGQGDLSQELGVPRQYNHPDVVAAVDQVLQTCRSHGVACGFPHVDADNIEELMDRGFTWLMPGFTHSFAALERGREIAASRYNSPADGR